MVRRSIVTLQKQLHFLCFSDSEYRITGNSRDRKHSRISRFVDHSRIFSSKSFHLIKRIELTATNIANGFEEDSTRECFLANGLNIEDSRMFSVARISRYTVP